MHYIRTFFKAIQLTIKGETVSPPQERYPNLQVWLDVSREKLEAVYVVAEQNGLDSEARKEIVLQLDGRPWTMDLILSSIQFHLETEFPSLMRSIIEHNLTTLYALHFDDKYRIGKLAESDELPASMRSVMRDFVQHFDNIPSSNDP